MKGISTITDENGIRKAVVIDQKVHGGLWEDVYDALTAARRKDEPRESLAEVKQRLARELKID